MINYSTIINKYNWILKPQNIILSPDSDGMLCGLFLSKYTNSKIVGRYDGKVLLIKNKYNYNECAFVDMDINRSHIKSIGHHCVMYNKKIVDINFNYDKNCIQPNLIRRFDGKNNFQQKYPFGTIHLLICILHHWGLVDTINNEGIRPLLFTDGVWNNLFGYTENCLERINYLGINNTQNPLYYHFCGNKHSFYNIMNGLNNFLRVRDSFNAQGYFNGTEYIKGGRNKRTGDKFKISNPKGELINMEKTLGLYHTHREEKERIIKFIKYMSEIIGREYKDKDWSRGNFNLKLFNKGDFSSIKLNNGTYTQVMEKNPFSMAMTSGTNIEYSLE